MNLFIYRIFIEVLIKCHVVTMRFLLLSFHLPSQRCLALTVIIGFLLLLKKIGRIILSLGTMVEGWIKSRHKGWAVFRIIHLSETMGRANF